MRQFGFRLEGALAPFLDAEAIEPAGGRGGIYLVGLGRQIHDPGVQRLDVVGVARVELVGPPIAEDAVQLQRGVIVHVATGEKFGDELINLQSIHPLIVRGRTIENPKRAVTPPRRLWGRAC